MAKVTKRGVYLDLNESPYIFKYKGAEYKFSSKFRLSKYVSDVTVAYARLGRLIETMRELTGIALSGSELDRQVKGMYNEVYKKVEVRYGKVQKSKEE